MNGRAGTLCLELLDLARAQRAAIEAGNVDEALALMRKRQGIVAEIQKIDTPQRLSDEIGRVLSVDCEVDLLIRNDLEATHRKLEALQNARILFRDLLRLDNKEKIDVTA